MDKEKKRKKERKKQLNLERKAINGFKFVASVFFYYY